MPIISIRRASGSLQAPAKRSQQLSSAVRREKYEIRLAVRRVTPDTDFPGIRRMRGFHAAFLRSEHGNSSIDPDVLQFLRSLQVAARAPVPAGADFHQGVRHSYTSSF